MTECVAGEWTRPYRLHLLQHFEHGVLFRGGGGNSLDLLQVGEHPRVQQLLNVHRCAGLVLLTNDEEDLLPVPLLQSGVGKLHSTTSGCVRHAMHI